MSCTRLALAGLFLTALTTSSAEAQPLRYGLARGSENWPAGVRDTVARSMDEAVAQFNLVGLFEKRVTANYNAGVPTAQANYDGWIDFGGQRNTRTALHELAHALGTGTYWQFNGGTWDENAAAGKLVKLFDGQGARLQTGGSHFWPYGLNYDNEDSPAARERHCKLVAAFRFDMGIVIDSDGDALPDDWETFHFAGLGESGGGDLDQDGISNLDEYRSDSLPTLAAPVRDGQSYRVRSQKSQRLLTSAEQVEVAEASDVATQRWTVRYAGEGFWWLGPEGDERVLSVDGADVASGRPLRLVPRSEALDQQWRIVGGVGAEPSFWQLSNRETGRVADALDGAEGAPVQQYPYLGNLPQQYWRFERLGDEEEDSGIEDAGAASRDAGPPDASARDAGARDGGTLDRSPRDGGSMSAPEEPAPTPDDAQDAGDVERGDGCSLATRASPLTWLLLALAVYLRRAAKPR